jgi:acyl carrier protein
MTNYDFLSVVIDAVRQECGNAKVDADATFTANGLDSIEMMGLLANLSSLLPVALSVKDLITIPTPRQLALALDIRHAGGLGQWLKANCSNATAAIENYTEFVIDTPYNSARAFFEVYTKEPLPNGNWGHNCIGLSQDAHARTIKDGPAAYLMWGRRRPVLFACSEEVYFADPYALHQGCLPIADLLSQEHCSRTYRCIPEDGHSMELIFDSIIPQLVQMKNTPRGTMTCQYSTELIIRQVSPLDKNLLFDNEQDNLSIRVLSENLDTTAHIVVPLAPAYRQRHLRGSCRPMFFAIHNDLVYDYGRPEFNLALDIVAAKVGVRPTEVIDFIDAAFWAYMDNAPEGLTFHKPHANSSNL